MIPHRTPFFLPWIYPSLTWRIPTTEKVLYLTFDDGPVPGPTDFVLEQLNTAAIKATFFCIGDNIRKHPQVLRNILDHGHAIGNHTFHHLNGWKTHTREYLHNIERCEKELAAVNAGLQFRLFRPPYGRITFSQIRSLNRYRIIMWDVLSADYNRQLSPEKCLRNTIRATRPGSIIVFHDSFKAERNMMYVLPRLITHFREQGFSFKALPE